MLAKLEVHNHTRTNNGGVTLSRVLGVLGTAARTPNEASQTAEPSLVMLLITLCTCRLLLTIHLQLYAMVLAAVRRALLHYLPLQRLLHALL